MRKTVLVVDDVEINRDLLEEILSDEYDVIKAKSGQEALEALEANRISVVALDLVMPVMDGFEVLKAMKKKRLIKKIPVLVITGETSALIESKCLEYGVCDFIRRPFVNKLVKQRVNMAADLYGYKNILETQVETQIDILQKQNEILQQQAYELEQSKLRIIDILGTVVEGRSLESGEHIRRVKGYTKMLAKKLAERYPEYNLTKDRIEMISNASALHDIGKIAIPDSILLKPAKLTKEEFEEMKTHSLKGSELLENIKGVWDEEYAKTSYEICRWHHEKYDGKGYPDGLKGEEIPISAQIVSVADVYDALVSVRVYKGAFTKQQAFDMIMAGECGQFSPKLMECFEEVKADFEDLAERLKSKEETE